MPRTDNSLLWPEMLRFERRLTIKFALMLVVFVVAVVAIVKL